MKRIGELLLNARNFLRHLSGLRVAYSLAALVALSACDSDLQTDHLEESVRVESVGVVLKTDSVFNFYQSYPGLSESMIVSDFSSALRRELMPASKNGQRSVDVQIQITRLNLTRQPGALSEGLLVYAYLFVQDRESGEMLVDKENVLTGVYVPEGPTGNQNMVQSYKALLAAFPSVVKQRLIK